MVGRRGKGAARGVGLDAGPTPPGGQAGFTYAGILVFTAVTGLMLAAFGEIASHAAQREKEAELLFRGDQYRQAIAAYHRIEDRYPQSLQDLILNKGFSVPVRHLRKLYPDPMTGAAEWGIVAAPDGGIMGVYSPAPGTPIKTGNFTHKDQAFEGARTYSDWKFVHSPPGLPVAVDNASTK